jgi:hypothetical protein
MITVAALYDGVRAMWREHRRVAADRQELRSCDPESVAGIAGDLRLTVPELGMIVADGAGSRRLLERMMAAFRIDEREVRREYPAVVRDVEITCARCSAKKRCSRELAAGTAAANVDRFCPNADFLSVFGRD